MVVNDRYNRQELIQGWNQEKLERSRVVVVGSGSLANYTLASLAAIGVGNIEIYDPAKVNAEHDGEFLLFGAKQGDSKTKALEEILKQINPGLRVKGLPMNLSSPLISILGKPDLIIDATNSPQSKQSILLYGNSKKIGVISTSADYVRSEMYYVSPGEDTEKAKLKEYFGKHQGSIPSGVMGGLITEELRKILMPLDKTDTPVKSLSYSLASDRRFSNEVSEEISADLKDKKALIIGAGALGNFAALGMALQGVGTIDILDYDTVDSTNLNRQILFYDSVGKEKATALCEKLRQINPRIQVNGLIQKLDENSDYFTKNHPDIILDCVDSFAVRATINYHAVRNHIPLVSGGTDPKSGQVVVYSPGKTECLECKMGVETALAEQRKAASCKYAPDPSVIMTNQIVGSMIVGEALRVLLEKSPLERILKYDSRVPSRGGLVGTYSACKCTKPDVATWLSEVDKKAAGYDAPQKTKEVSQKNPKDPAVEKKNPKEEEKGKIVKQVQYDINLIPSAFQDVILDGKQKIKPRISEEEILDILSIPNNTGNQDYRK